jgi:hypothetical protein
MDSGWRGGKKRGKCTESFVLLSKIVHPALADKDDSSESFLVFTSKLKLEADATENSSLSGVCRPRIIYDL